MIFTYSSILIFPSSTAITVDIENGNYRCSSASDDIGQCRPDYKLLCYLGQLRLLGELGRAKGKAFDMPKSRMCTALIVVFDRKVQWTIFGGTNDCGNWRRRYNFKLYKIFRDVDILEFIRLNKIRWAAHLMRMESDRAVFKVFHALPFGQRPRRKPKKWWADFLVFDFCVIKIKNSSPTAKRRTAWLNLLNKTKAHKGLSSYLWWCS